MTTPHPATLRRHAAISALATLLADSFWCLVRLGYAHLGRAQFCAYVWALAVVHRWSLLSIVANDWSGADSMPKRLSLASQCSLSDSNLVN